MKSFHLPHYAISSRLGRILARLAHKIEAHSCTTLYNTNLNALIQNDLSVNNIFRVQYFVVSYNKNIFIQKMVHSFTLKLVQFLFSSFKYIVQNGFVFVKNEIKEEPILKGQCASCTFREDIEVSYDDVNVAMKRLGIIIDNKGQNNSLIKEVNVILEKKLASVEDLKEAFEVFDNDRDGFITPTKLWILMEKLGLIAEMRYEDCDKMIRVYDMDGDGKISFNEFKHMMENAG
jgi:EF-hand domain pair